MPAFLHHEFRSMTIQEMEKMEERTRDPESGERGNPPKWRIRRARVRIRVTMMSNFGLRSAVYTPAWLLLVALLTILPGRFALAADDDGVASAASSAVEAAPATNSSGFDWSRPGEITFDVLVLRPLGAAASCVGFGAFVVSVPFVAPSSGLDTSWEIFVLGPVEYTFQRPVGIF